MPSAPPSTAPSRPPNTPPRPAPPGRLTSLVRRLILVWLVVISFDVGCSARCAGSTAANASRKRQIKKHVFNKTAAEVFDGARAAATRRGYTLDRPAAVKDALYTSRDKPGAGSEKRTLTVRIDKRRLTGGVKLKIHEIVTGGAGQEPLKSRLYDLELEVIKRLEPVKGQAIELIAAAHRRTAEQGARGCGCAESCTPAGCEGCQNCLGPQGCYACM